MNCRYIRKIGFALLIRSSLFDPYLNKSSYDGKKDEKMSQKYDGWLHLKPTHF